MSDDLHRAFVTVALAEAALDPFDRTEPASASVSRFPRWLVPAAVVILSGAYMLHFIDRGWIPHDEGTLAHSAERVLAGELPHRDFVEGYTGGLTYLNAFAFRLFGVHLLAIRYVLFAAFIAWVLVFHHVVARMVPPLVAGTVTLLAVFWSVPNYPAAMPSWYNLFLATTVMAALLQYIDSNKLRWLVGAGCAGGLSVLMKTPGVMIVAGGLLSLIYHETQGGWAAREEAKAGVIPHVAVGGLLLAAVVSLLAIGLSRATVWDLYQFALPGFAMVAIVGRKVVQTGGISRSSFRAMQRAALAFLCGAALPVVAFVAYYAAEGALAELARDVLILPARTMVGASLPPHPPFALLPIGMAAFVVTDFRGRFGRIAILQDALGVSLIALSIMPKSAIMLEPFVWASLAEATPIVVSLLAILIARHEARGGASVLQSRYVLLGCVAAFCSLVQYPFAAPIYFAYSFPLLLLAVVATVQLSGRVRKRAMQGMATVYLVYGALYIAPMPLPGLLGPVRQEDTARLSLPRAGLRIARADAENYQVAVELLRTHASSGVIYAGPDAPEMYFLSELQNPTPALFDYLVADTLFHRNLLRRLDPLGVNVVALRRHVSHSPPLEPDIRDSLAGKYPMSREVGNFTIRWR